MHHSQGKDRAWKPAFSQTTSSGAKEGLVKETETYGESSMFQAWAVFLLPWLPDSALCYS